MSSTLSPDRRTQLDGIVSQMHNNGETDDYIQSVVDDFKQKYGSASTQPAPKPLAKYGSQYELIAGTTPEDLADRTVGAARAIGKAGFGALQYGQYLAGRKVSPTPLFLEPTTNPNDQLGGKLARATMTAAPLIATSGASLPVQVAAGSLAGGISQLDSGQRAAQTGAVVGGLAPVAVKAVGGAIEKANEYLDDNEFAAKLWNRVARVKAGRSGTQMNMATGDLSTLPGRAMVGEGGGIKESLKALLASPNDDLREASYGQLQDASKTLADKLANVKTKVDISGDLNMDNPKIKAALESLGITGKPTAVTPSVAHDITQAIGERANWNPNVMSDSNEELKDAFSSIRQKVLGVVGNDVKGSYKDWQEAYLFNKALKTTMEKAANNPLSAVTPGFVAKRAAQAGVAGSTLYGLGKMLGLY